METLRESSLYLDSPSKQSYIGSYYLPPERMSIQQCAPSQGKSRPRRDPDLREVSSHTHPATPDAGSRAAVIAALKTLQEKMRRLELERAQAKRNVEKFSQTTQRCSTSAAKTEQQLSARQGDSLRRKELMSQLHSAEARCSLLEKQLDYMRKMVEGAEREKITLTDGEKCLQQNERTPINAQIEAQLQKLERLEKEYLKLTNTQVVAERKIELLERKLLEEEHERKLVQEKAEELQRELQANILTLSAAEVKPKKKKSKEKKSLKTEVSVPQRFPKTKRMPFVAGTSTSPSHSVNANVQSVLHLLKTREPRLCERARSMHTPTTENCRRPRKASASHRDGAAALGSLSELLLDLQDELGQMSFEHQELVRQIDETDKQELREDLERELDCLVKKMEEKAGQISKLRKHQQAVQKLSRSSPRPTQKPRRAASVDSRTLSGVVGVVRAQPLSPAKVSPSRAPMGNQDRLQLLRDAKKLRSNLCQQDISWET